MLTKSLHTVTAATNVARQLLTQRPEYYSHGAGAENLAADTLCWLGHGDTAEEFYCVASDSLRAERIAADPTVTRIVAACAKLLSASQGPRRGIYQADVHA